ncbi:hypothetical protein [Campylobacter coli]|uniref:hypothetical protein n=1 Tax=Campylobacter coli TaxID=195 RepID=UPI000AEB721A
MNFKELISKRRACKLFNDKKISEEDLHFILESGILAPSSRRFGYYFRDSKIKS